VADTRQPTLSPAAQAVYNNSQDSLRRKVAIQMNSLTPDMYRNFQDIVNTYPGMSKDLIMAMVSQGLTASTPGIGKIVSIDGIAQLKNDMMNVDKIKSTVAKDRGFLGTIGDAFRNVVYDPFKGATRLTFAALRYPYDSFTAAVRDVSVGKLPGIGGRETQLGALLADTFGGKPGVDTGSGFFIDPKSRVGKDQAKAMSAYGQIYGESFTIGRFLAKSVGATPDQTAYKVMSGFVDATLNLALDPTTYAAVGPVAKALKLGKYRKGTIAEMVKKAEPFNQPVAKRVEEVDAVIKDLKRKRWGLIRTNTRRIEDKILKKERNLAKLESERFDALSGTFGKILNATKAMGEGLANNPFAQRVLSQENIINHILYHDKTASGELVRGIGKLSAETKNTKGFAAGNLVLDELPESGRLSIAAHGSDEYLVTTLDDAPLKVLDLSEDLSKLTGKAYQAEQYRRSEFLDALRGLADDPELAGPVRQVLNDVSALTQADTMALKGFAWATGVTQEAGNFRTLGDIFRKIAESGSEAAMFKAFDLLDKIWDFDAISNIRTIYGETGGVLLNGGKPKFGYVQAEIGNALAEIADPTNLGPNMAKLLASIKTTDESIGKVRTQLEKAKADRDSFAERVKELDIFRQVANQDIETATKLLSDPDYKGLSDIVKINSELAEKNILREWISNQVGLTDNFGGNLADDISKPLKWMLGRNFSRIAEVVAKETDPVKIRRFFGNKLEYETEIRLAAAKTTDEVLATFLSVLNPGMDLAAYRSLSLRLQTGLLANPAMRLVDSPDLKLVKVAETLDRTFGRFYARSTVLNLGDGTNTIQGWENWVSSAKFKSVIGAKAQEAFIDDTLRKLYKAESAAERGAIIEKATVDLTKTIVERLRLPAEQADELGRVIKLGSAEKNIVEQYSTIQRAMGEEPTFVFAGDEAVPLGKAVGLDQLLKQQAFLPDSQAVMKAIIKFEAAKLKQGRKAFRAFSEELGDIWRTAQLAFRISYILRNIGEMQMRQMFAGHASIFSHPIQFIAFVMATSGKNGPLGKISQKVARWQYDALGNKFTPELTDGDVVDSIKGYQLQRSRGESVSDYQQSRKSEIFKTYSLADSKSPDYFEGLSFVLNRWATDDMYPAVAKLMQLGDENAKLAFVDRLIKEFDKPGNAIREMTFGAFEKNPGIKRIFLRDANLPITKDNLHKERIFAYLFDETPGNETYANRIKSLVGNGSASNILMDIIIGEAKIATESGKFVTLKSPWLTGAVKTPAQLGTLEKRFKETLAKHLKPENLTNSTVIVQKPVYSQLPGGKMLNNWIDKFFNIAAKYEGKYNFGPEYVMTYWDNIAEYAPLLSLDDLKRLQPNAIRALAPISKQIGGKARGFALPSKTLRKIEKEIIKRQKSGVNKPTGYTLENINSIAATEASKKVANLFYDAARQKQWSQAMRLVFPFAQAHTNTISKWGELAFKNPVPIYRFAKAFDSLTKPGSNVIYDVSGMTYDDDQGFFYKENPEDPNSDLKFKMPVVGSVLGGLVGKNIDMGQALQITAPVQSLNLAFGQANPVIPGLGPAVQLAFIGSGKVNQFGAGYDVLRDIVTPFGAVERPEDVVFPAWLKKTVLYAMGNSTVVNRGIKDWSSYLASTGQYGDDPLSNDATRNQLFNDAETLSKSLGIWMGLFQSISPATPQSEILVKIKNPENKMKFMTGTMLYDYWNKIQEQNPGNYGAAVRQFAETFGKNNIMVALSGTTSAITGTDDAWNFLNNNPDAADKYAKSTTDIVPYFFPGGAEFAVKYYNWQRKTGVRQQLTADQLEREAETMIYAMRKDQIAQEQIANGYTDFWYVDQVAQLDKEFGGRPPEQVTTATAYEKINRIGKALQDRAFEESPVYEQAIKFYPIFVEFQAELNRLKVSNYASLTSKGGYATLLRDNLVALAEQLMIENPSFRRMYYGVFAGQLED
jgi:hypothetical protein